MSDLYVYAMVPTVASTADGLVEEPVRLVDCGGMHAAVGPALGGDTVDASALRAHDAVVRRLHGLAGTVLPMRFGSTVRDESALRGWVETVRSILERGLEAVKDREQMAIRVYGDAAPGEAHVQDYEGERRGTRYLLSRRQIEIPPHLESAVETLRRRLGHLVCSERVERHATPPLLLTLRHLVARDMSPEYRAAVSGEIPGLEGLTLRVSGPWPPYAFTPEELS
jgi:hypothetical protein